MIEREGFLDDRESGILRERIEPRLVGGGTHPRPLRWRGTRTLDGAEHEKRFIEAEVAPLDHVGIREAFDEDVLAPAVFVDDFEWLAEARLRRVIGDW
jgi:hypothetical protein